MLRACRVALSAALVTLAVATPAGAQRYNPQQTQINIQYHEVIPAGADSAPVFLKIFDRIRQDCELIGKAFSRRCLITQINMNMNTNYGGDMSGVQHLNANAMIVLPPEPAESSPSPASPPSPLPASPPPASPR